MKTKTLIELITLSSSIYVLARDTQLLEKLNEYSEIGKDNLNKMMSDSKLDENGNEIEFVDQIINKTNELKEQLNEKIEALVVQFYKKIHVAHTDELRALNIKLEKLESSVALLEARLNKLEA